MSSSHVPRSRPGFLGALFDAGLTTFVTLRVLQVVYVLEVVLIAVGGALALGYGIAQGGRTALVSIGLVPSATLVALVLARMHVELVAVFFRIGEDLSTLARRAQESRPDQRPRVGALEY